MLNASLTLHGLFLRGFVVITSLLCSLLAGVQFGIIPPPMIESILDVQPFILDCPSHSFFCCSHSSFIECDNQLIIGSRFVNGCASSTSHFGVFPDSFNSWIVHGFPFVHSSYAMFAGVLQFVSFDKVFLNERGGINQSSLLG